MESVAIKGNGNIELESSNIDHSSQIVISQVINNNDDMELGEEKRETNSNNNTKIGKYSCDCLLRGMGFALTLTSAVILGVNKQNKVVAFKLVDSLPPLMVPVSAKWHYLSAFLYFVIANAIACTYAAISLILALTTHRGGKSLGLIIFTLDVAMVGLLFSSNGATTAIGLMGYKGNSHVRWKKVCDVFGKFCNQAIVALVISYLGATSFLLLVILAAKRLHNK